MLTYNLKFILVAFLFIVGNASHANQEDNKMAIWTYSTDFNDRGAVGETVNITTGPDEIRKHHANSDPGAAVWDNTRTRPGSNRSIKVTISANDENQNVIIRPGEGRYPEQGEEFWIGWWEYWAADSVFDTVHGQKFARIYIQPNNDMNIVVGRGMVNVLNCDGAVKHIALNYDAGDRGFGTNYNGIANGHPPPGHQAYFGGGERYADSYQNAPHSHGGANIRPYPRDCEGVKRAYSESHPYRIAKGRWQWNEAYWYLSSNTDGKFRFWMDGRLAYSFNGVTWRNYNQPTGRFGRFYFNGGSNTKGVVFSWFNQWDGQGNTGRVPHSARGKNVWLGGVTMTTDPANATARDSEGNAMIGTQGELPDNGGGTPPPADPLTINNHRVETTTTTANLIWTTNRPANSVVDYGETEDRGTIARDDNMKTNHAVALEGLTENTAYFYRFSSRDEGGNTAMDPENKTFTTTDSTVTPPPVDPPIDIDIELALNDLTDVDVPAPEEDMILIYRNGKWTHMDVRPYIDERIKALIEGSKITVG